MSGLMSTIKKNAPTILMVGGIALGVTATIFACKGTLHAKEIMDKAKTDREVVEEAKETKKEEYTESMYKDDLINIYKGTTIDIIKTYAPAAAIGAAAIGCIVQGQNILNKRNVVLTSAFAVLNAGYAKYRSNVEERFGTDTEKEINFGIKEKEVEEIVTDDNGKKKKKKTKEKVIDDDPEYSPYARIFDPSSRDWQDNAEYNLSYLCSRQAEANEKLKRKGHLFLNDVYKMLDFPETKEGQLVGWVYDPKNPDAHNEVDFGIWRPDIAHQRFIQKLENCVFLDFNVEGNILDYI